MNLPNKLTVSRIILTFVFMIFLFSKGLLAKSMALIVFVVASLTDFYDGHIAKRKHMVTDFGRLMDPIADKILILAAFLGLNNLFRNTYISLFNVQIEILPAWMVLLIMLRELIITSLRIMAAKEGKVIAATASGKHKTASQMVAILGILSFLVFKEVSIRFFNIWNASIEYWSRWAIFLLMLLTVILTLISGGIFLVRNREVWLGAKTD